DTPVFRRKGQDLYPCPLKRTAARPGCPTRGRDQRLRSVLFGTDRRRRGRPESAIEHDSQRLPGCQLEWAIGESRRQRGIIVKDGADPADNGIPLPSESMRVL